MAIEREASTLDLATKEQLESLKALFAGKEIPSGLENKWFAKANVSGWDEMPRERVDAAIKYIEENF